MTDKAEDARITGVGAEGYVSAADVLTLRRAVFADGIVSRAELGALFTLAERAPEGDREWPDYFAEAAADFLLGDEEPRGYLTEEEFSLLRSFVERSGRSASSLELSLLVGLLEKAIATPPAMTGFIADQFRDAFKAGAKFTAHDVDLLRRYLYAVGGDGATAITRAEAELLFDLHDATKGAANDASWADLFVKTVAAHLMAQIGYRPLPREEALRLHDWVRDQSVSPAGFFNRMISGGLATISALYKKSAPASARKESAAAEQVTSGEADWLAERIGCDGALDDAERALLVYMTGLGADLPPKLKALVDRAA